MASGTTSRVFISDILIIEALNSPGGSGKVYAYLDGFADYIKTYAMALAPVNDPMNAMHREGVVGTYKASFKWDRKGSGGHSSRRTVYNTSDHAKYVEFGRGDSRWGLSFALSKGYRGGKGEKRKKVEVKSGNWEAYTVAGGYGHTPSQPWSYLVTKGTAGYKGKHVLRDATIIARQTYRFQSATFRPFKYT